LNCEISLINLNETSFGAKERPEVTVLSTS
jgi:hypothetical protein